MLRKSLNQGMVCAVMALSITAFSAFKTGNSFETYLYKVISPAGQTTMEYNPDKTIRKIVQQHGTGTDRYAAIQVPVYEAGKIVKTLLADESGADGELYKAFQYDQAGRLLKILSYRQQNLVRTDSLAYNEAGRLSMRYLSSLQPGTGKWIQDGYQQLQWDGEGNVTAVENYGKQPGYSKFINTSTVTYTYDNKQNPQQQRELALILDAGAASLSAHNVLSETIESVNSSRAVKNTWSYAYNAGKFPVRATLNTGLDGSTVKLEWIKLQ